MPSLKKFLVSSANPEQVSMTIKGMLLAFIPFVLLAVNALGIGVGEGDLKEVVEAVGAFVVAIMGSISSVMVLYGLVRKIIVKIRAPR